MIITSDKPYYVATNEDASIVHYGCKLEGLQVETGMPNCLCIETEEEYLAELAKYGIEPDIL